VLAGVVELHEVVFLSGGELGLFAAEPTLRPGDLHAFAGAHPDQVGLAGVGDGAGEPVQLGDDSGIASPACCQRLAQAGPVAVGAGKSVVDVDPVRADAELVERVCAVRSWASVDTRA